MKPVRILGTRLSPFVEKVVRACHLKKAPYELVPPSRPGDFATWNPQTRKMPVAEFDGERVYDSTFILRRLDAEAPEPPLFASDPAVAGSQRLLEDWADEALYWYLLAIRGSPSNRVASANQIAGRLPPLLLQLVQGNQIRVRHVDLAPHLEQAGR